MDNAEVLFELSDEDKKKTKSTLWNMTKEQALNCDACALSKTRLNVVFGDGDPDSGLMFVGEGPGADEDEQALPFVGRAGKLLTQILKSVDIDRKDVYITNIVKCRPPGNRVPTPEEMLICDKHLQRQIMIMNPALLVLLGNTPTKWILKTSEGITKTRGKWFNWRGIAVMPMFHPSYLLRNASSKEGSPKHLTWLDIQEIKRQWTSVKETGKTDGIKFGEPYSS
jgi:uracil-DNA glycosylase family 4